MMRRVVGRFLLAGTAALPIAGALWDGPAHGDMPLARGPAVMKCSYFKDAMIISPGLSNTPTDQTIAAHGRVYGCNKAGGSAKFTATLIAGGATCSNRRFVGQAHFVWTNGRSSTVSVTFNPAATQARKVEVIGNVTDGLFQGLLMHSWVRTTDTFKGSGPGCEAANLLKRMEFTNSRSLQVLTPITVPTTPPRRDPPTTAPTTVPVSLQGSTVPNVIVPVTQAAADTTTTTRPAGDLAFTGSSSSRGALLGLEALVAGGAIWALAGRGGRRHLDRAARGRRRRELYVTLPAQRD